MKTRFFTGLAVALTVATSLFSCKKAEPVKLQAPAVTATETSQFSLTLSWDAVENAASYEYSFNGATGATTKATTVSFTDLTPGTQYSFKIVSIAGTSAFLDSEIKEYSFETASLVQLSCPEVKVSDVTIESFKVSWDKVPDAVEYEYKMGEETKSTMETALQFDGLESNKEYSFEIRSIAADGGIFEDSPWKITKVTTLSPENLSKNGTANCYIVTKEGTYCFNATVQGNGQATTGITPASIAPAGAKLVWQDDPNTITDLSINKNGEIIFNHSGKKGNALIAATDASGVILWSWHIWNPGDEFKELKSSDNNNTIMNMDLGATTAKVGEVGSYGLLYQWGRKDPFLNIKGAMVGTTTTIGGPAYDADGKEVKMANKYSQASVETAIKNPTTCYASYGKSDGNWCTTLDNNLWGNPDGGIRSGTEYPNKGEKSIYDPCPVGWAVPDAGAFHKFTTTGGYTEILADSKVTDINNDGKVDENDWNYGFVFDLGDGVTSYFPAQGRYYGDYGLLYGSVCGIWGNYWSNAPYESNPNYAFSNLSYQIVSGKYFSISPTAGTGRSNAFAIRCIKK